MEPSPNTTSQAPPESPPATGRPGEERLLGFYDRLRRRILRWVDGRGGRAGERVARTLVTVPDVFLLLVRLSLDKEVPERHRALIGGALAYFLLPFDLLPEGALGPVGYVDDLVLVAMVLESAFDRRLESLSRRHWSGSEDLRKVLQELVGTGSLLLGDRLYRRLRRLLARRGWLGPPPAGAADGSPSAED